MADKEVRKIFANSVSSLFRELSEYIAEADVELQLFKAASSSY